MAKEGLKSMADAEISEFSVKGPGYKSVRKNMGEYAGVDIDADSLTTGHKLSRDKPPKRGSYTSPASQGRSPKFLDSTTRKA